VVFSESRPHFCSVFVLAKWEKLCFMMVMEQTHAPSLSAATDTVASFPTARLRARIDGWTPEKQRLFCETLADCGLVREAAAAVGMSPQSAYALRRRAEGRAFSTAWDAALYLARHRLMDIAIERAMEGNLDTVSKDGAVVGERRHQDMRHLLAAITKLEGASFADRATRSVASEFDLFLDAMEADANRAVALPNDANDGEAPDRAASHAARFFADRQGRGADGYIAFDWAADRMRRARGDASRPPRRSILGSITQEDVDAWDEIERWEAEDRAKLAAAHAEASSSSTGQTV
jgi:hypothetical protein